MRLTRVLSEPVLTPRPGVAWEKDAVCNAAAVYADGAFHLLYRAVQHPGGLGAADSNRSSIGYARSTDGVHFERLDAPVLAYGAPGETHGVEDPRVTSIDGRWLMLYTSYDGRTAQVSMAESADLRHWKRLGVTIPESLFGCWNKDAALFPRKFGGRYAAIHRPEPNMVVSFSEDLRAWTDHHLLMAPRPGTWEERKVGLGAAPIETDFGWLLITHAVDRDMVYRLGVAVLDRDDPTKLLWRQEEPILEPELPWELAGDVPNVVFTCGAVLLDGIVWVYYGAADRVIGLAKVPLADVPAW